MKNHWQGPLDQEDDELYDELYPVASSMECTGLIPAAPATESEAESYGQIYDIPLAKEAQPANHHLQRTKASDDSQHRSASPSPHDPSAGKA
ncbi:MAG: hypothetical protein HFJ80_02080 [Clostridiales bacterium]|nr:hypothetical protein [Clostridiales bacterium]